MTNPYAPPKKSEYLPAVSIVDVVLRWGGGLSLVYMAVRTLISDHTPFISKLLVVPLMVGLAFGVRIMKRESKFHLGVAIFMLVSVSVQANMMNKAISNPELLTIPIPENPWTGFATSVIPHAIALICTFALYLRAWMSVRAWEREAG